MYPGRVIVYEVLMMHQGHTRYEGGKENARDAVGEFPRLHRVDEQIFYRRGSLPPLLVQIPGVNGDQIRDRRDLFDERIHEIVAFFVSSGPARTGNARIHPVLPTE